MLGPLILVSQLCSYVLKSLSVHWQFLQERECLINEQEIYLFSHGMQVPDTYSISTFKKAARFLFSDHKIGEKMYSHPGKKDTIRRDS